MTPEAKARLLIDERLQQGGWLQPEIIEHLEAALNSFRDVAAELAKLR